MADRIIKPDSGNDVVIQNNGGTRKIEVTNSGNIEFVGDLGFTGDTDSKIKLPSAGGIYESDGSTEILTESSGAVTLKNTTIDSNVVFPAGGTGNPISVAVILDQKGATTDAGGSDHTAGLVARELNTKHDPDSIATLSSNQFTLGAGTYLISWSCPAIKSDRHSTVLRDVTGSANLISGSSEYVLSSGNLISTRSMGSYIHTISANNTYEIRQQVHVSTSTYGLGIQSQNGVNSIYTIVVIYKLK